MLDGQTCRIRQERPPCCAPQVPEDSAPATGVKGAQPDNLPFVAGLPSFVVSFCAAIVVPMQTIKVALEERKPPRSVPTASAVFKDGAILEMLHDPEARETRFALWRNGAWTTEEGYALNAVERLVPFSAANNLIKNGIVRLPKAPEEYGSEEQLLTEVKSFIHRYVDVSPLYEEIASYYVLFSWVYDGFNELPYLHVRGDYGTGKTRFLLTVGAICYKAIFASGASTVSPIFRLLETFQGTLIIDECDFRFSDEKAELVKILNNGNVRGFPVLRSDANNKGEFNPNAYHVFGPKIVATRGDFEDRALESRFVTEDMGSAKLREGIPINLPPEHKTEALTLRNKLLLFRFRNLNKHPTLAHLVDRSLEPRLNQIFVPLLSIIDDPKAQERLKGVARQCQRELVSERGLSTEAQVLEVIQELQALSDTRLSIKEITDRFTDLHGDEYKHKITHKWVSYIIHKKLHLKSRKSNGVYVIGAEEYPKLTRMYEQYGLTAAQAVQAESVVEAQTGMSGTSGT